MPKDELIASFSAEQTARFLGGGDLGPATYHDPQVAARMRRQRASLRGAWSVSIGQLGDALSVDSPQTARRLLALWNEAEDGNPRAHELLAGMLYELLRHALDPEPEG